MKIKKDILRKSRTLWNREVAVIPRFLDAAEKEEDFRKETGITMRQNAADLH